MSELYSRSTVYHGTSGAAAANAPAKLRTMQFFEFRFCVPEDTVHSFRPLVIGLSIAIADPLRQHPTPKRPTPQPGRNRTGAPLELTRCVSPARRQIAPLGVSGAPQSTSRSPRIYFLSSPVPSSWSAPA